MLNFIYNTPTKVYFGKGYQREVGKIIKEYGFSKIMLQYGKNSIKKNGIYDEVVNSLNENGIKFIEMGGVEPNPKLEFVREAIKLARQEQVELILAVGGGSVIDSSKATALGVKYNGDVWDIFMGKHTPVSALPTACILTHSAAGSEMSMSAVISDLSINMKKGCGTELNRCLFSILNPELTYTVSKYQTACGIVDMMTHTLERYFTALPDTELTDSVAEAILKSIVKASLVVIDNPTDYDARATLMWGSSLAHNGLTSCGRENYLAVHQLEHAISGVYDNVAHGAGLAVLYPAWAKFIYKHNIKRFARLARNVWDVNDENDELCALKGIQKMQEFFIKIGMPSTLKEFNVTEKDIEKFVKICTNNGQRTVKSYIPLGESEIAEIFKICL